MLHYIVPLMITVGAVFLISIVVYFAIRYFAYKRSFPLPHRFDLLWILNTLLILFLSISLQSPLEDSISPKILTWITFAAFLLSAYILIFILDQFFVEYFLVSILKVYISPPLRKVIVLGIFLIAVVIGVQKIFSINPWAVYAPTSMLSLGIGIALKDSFQTFFAGLALSKIMHIGDWIQIDGKEGEVVDINWARTVLRTKNGDHLFIPNSELQKGMFTNFCYQGKKHRCRFEVGASYSAPPQKVKRTLIQCAQNVEGVLSYPAPEVLLSGYGDFSIQYLLYFWVDDYSQWREITSDVSTRVWYAFKRENIEIPFPIRTVYMAHEKSEGSDQGQLETMLSKIDLFSMLSQDEKQLIVGKLDRRIYLKGETVVQQGEAGSSFYLVAKGKLEVLRRDQEDKTILLGELGPGQFFGELSLLTGEPRSATVRATMDTEILRLEKVDFQEILNRHPDLAENLAEVVASHKTALSEIKEHKEVGSRIQEQKSALSKKIRNFFNL